MKNINWTKWLVTLLTLTLCAGTGFAGNEPGEPGYETTYDSNCELTTDNKCVSVYFSTGPMRNQIDLPPGRIGFMSETPSPTHSTRQALSVVTGLYGIQRVVGNEVDILDNKKNKITFVFPSGSAEAAPSEQYSTWNAALKKVDAQGILTTGTPVYYDLYTFNGLERVRFDADTNSVSYLRMVNLRTSEGQVYDADEFGMSCIYDEEGIIRQVMAPTRMMDFVTFDEFKYEVRFYEPQDVSMGTNGLYEVLAGAQPFEFHTVENWTKANPYDVLNVSRTVGGTTRTFHFVYMDAQNMWFSTEDESLTHQISTMVWDDAKENCIRTKQWTGTGEGVVCKWIKRIVQQPWGQALMEREDRVSATESQINAYTYYSDDTESNRYSKVATAQLGDGTWWVRDYDSEGRKSIEISSWQDVSMTTNVTLAKAVTYDYIPHEAATDVPLEFDERPRTETETIEGIVTKKTFHTYKTNSLGAQVHITERCASQTASYGDASSLRTTKTYYPPYEGNNFQDLLNQGRIKTTQYPDGRVKTVEYALGDLTMNATNPAASLFTVNTNGLDWRVTTIHGTTNSPNGIANKTLKEVTIKDARSNVALRETYVYTGSGYERIKWTVKQFDVYGHALETWHSDGTQESGYWGTGCCGKDNGTDRQGIETAYTYDLNKRMISASKQTTNDTAGVTQTYTYDAKGRRLSTVRSADGITALTNSATFDMLGRKLQKNVENGASAQWSYNDANYTVTETRPGGATRITAKYADGRIKSIVGTAVVAETVEYGVNSDGSFWTKRYSGPDGTSSPMWKKATKDMLGRTVKTEKPAFGGGVLATENSYDTAGHLRSSVSISGSNSVVSLYEYDELGNRVRSGIDVDKDDELTLTSMDRISDFETSFVKESGDWYNERTQIIYPNDDSSVALTNSVSKTRLTGLGTTSDLGLLISETVSTDRFENQTVQKRFVDRDNKTTTKIIDVPTSTQVIVQVTVNGLLQSATSAQSTETLYSYDALERRIEQRSDSDGGSRSVATLSRYNDKNQIHWTEDAATNRTTYAYELDTGRKIAETNALGNSTLYTYNERGQITAVGGSSQYPIEYGYDDEGRMTDLYTLRGATNGWDRTQWLYDSVTGLMTNKLDDAGNGPTYTYTPDGKLATRIWARGITTTYSYDSAGSLTNTAYSDSTSDISLDYDRLGRNKAVSDAQGTRTFDYDPDTLTLSSETIISGGTTNVITRSYDSQGRASDLDLNSNYSVDYGYSSLGQFDNVESVIASVTNEWQYSYISGSDLISSVSNLQAGIIAQRSYEPNRDLITEVHNQAQSATVSKFEYQNDALGRRSQRIDTASSIVTNGFGYDARSQLTNAVMGAESFVWEFDNIGNRETYTTNGTTFTYLANELNQYANISNGTVEEPTFDADGNTLTCKGWTLSWNGENRLQSASNGSDVVVFQYDYMGRRFSKTVDSVSTNHFIYDGWNLISETVNSTTNNASTNHYVWGLDLSGNLQGAGGVGGLLGVIESNDEVYFPAMDANGNIIEYTDGSGTNIVAHYVYNAYGELIDSDGSKKADFVFRFSTKCFDSETDLYYYGFRYYNPETGRWINRDPSEEKGGLNLYGFVQNNPYNNFDFLGMKTCCPDEVAAVLAEYSTCAVTALSDWSGCKSDALTARDAVLTELTSTYDSAKSSLDAQEASCKSNCSFWDDLLLRTTCEIECKLFYDVLQGALFGAYWANVGVAGATYTGLVAGCGVVYGTDMSSCSAAATGQCDNLGAF